MPEIADYRTKWYGTQTVENTAAIAERLRHLLTSKLYTFVTVQKVYAHSSGGVDVRTDQRLEIGKSGESIIVTRGSDYAMLSVIDSSGTWSKLTTATDGQDDPPYKHPFWVFEKNQAQVTFMSGEGNLVVYVVAVQEGTDA